MWVFLSWDMNLEEALRLHLLLHEVQPSWCSGPVVCCSAICLWLPALVTPVSYFFMAELFQSLYGDISPFFFCSHAVVFVLLDICQPWCCCCVSMRRKSHLKITPYFLLLSSSINLLKIPFFCPSQRRNFHDESWGVPPPGSLLIKPCARRKIPFRRQLHADHAHIPAEPWNFPGQPLALPHWIISSSFSTLFSSLIVPWPVWFVLAHHRNRKTLFHFRLRR